MLGYLLDVEMAYKNTTRFIFAIAIGICVAQCPLAIADKRKGIDSSAPVTIEQLENMRATLEKSVNPLSDTQMTSMKEIVESGGSRKVLMSQFDRDQKRQLEKALRAQKSAEGEASDSNAKEKSPDALDNLPADAVSSESEH